MSWKIEYKRSEKFIYKHSRNWLLRRLGQVKEFNNHNEQIGEEELRKYSEITIGEESLHPVALNLNLIIHVGEMREFKQQYQKLTDRNEISSSIPKIHNHEDEFKKSSLQENNQFAEMVDLKLKGDEFFDYLFCSIYRITESFTLITFRFILSKTIYEKFDQILSSYKYQKPQIINFRLSQLYKQSASFSIYDNALLTKNDIYLFLERIRNAGLATLREGIIRLHIGNTHSIFTLYAFSYRAKPRENQTRNSSLFYRLGLGLGEDGFNKFSNPEDSLSVLYTVGEYHALDTNSEMFFFNEEAYSEDNLEMYGNDFRNVVSFHLRLSLGLSINHDFSIITILLYYYELLTNYRYHKYRKYRFFPIYRYEKLLKETHFLRSFTNEYKLNLDDIKYYHINYLGDLTQSHFEGTRTHLYEVIYNRLNRLLSSINALETNISSIISSQRDNAIIKSNKNMQRIVVVLAVVSITTQIFGDKIINWLFLPG